MVCEEGGGCIGRIDEDVVNDCIGWDEKIIQHPCSRMYHGCVKRETILNVDSILSEAISIRSSQIIIFIKHLDYYLMNARDSGFYEEGVKRRSGMRI